MTVEIEELDVGGLTNIQGRFLLMNVAAGARTLSFLHPEFGSGSVEVQVVEGETVNTEASLGG